MARAGSKVRKKVWRKVVVGLLAGAVAVGSLVYWKRYEIALWNMEGNKKAQEIIILQMQEYAKPLIKSEITMTLPEKTLSFIAGQKNEKQRQADALDNVRKFAESGFANHWLKFEDVHRLDSLNGFNLRGFDFALTWSRGNKLEVLNAFNVNFLKREVGQMKLNEDCSFFPEMKLYIEKKSTEN